ncbi:MAG: hypothetical protein WC812_02285 [Candidatus Pacearchaeota archaeon]|jgi:hypothetical protein
MTEKKPEPKKEPSILEKTLLREDFMQIVGANLVKANPNEYGSRGVNYVDPVYSQVMNSEAVNNIRLNEYQKSKQEYEARGVFGDPSYLSNPEISNLVIRQIDEVMEKSSLGELYSVVKKIAPGLDFKLPDKLKGLSREEVINNVIKKGAITKEGGLDAKKLSPEEQDYFGFYQLISNAYKEISALSLMNSGFYSSINAMGNQLGEKYFPKPKEKEKKKE